MEVIFSFFVLITPQTGFGPVLKTFWTWQIPQLELDTVMPFEDSSGEVSCETTKEITICSRGSGSR